jgi:F0F1-type ATP synthase assembly protein I
VRGTIGPISIIISLGALVVVATLLPLVAGLWLDSQLKTTPWLTLVGLVVGVIAALIGVYRVISEQYKQSG